MHVCMCICLYFLCVHVFAYVFIYVCVLYVSGIVSLLESHHLFLYAILCIKAPNVFDTPMIRGLVLAQLHIFLI